MEIQQRQHLGGPPNSPEYVHLSSTIDLQLDQLRHDVNHLKSLIDNATLWGTRSEEELKERNELYDKLNEQLYDLECRFSKNTHANKVPIEGRSSGHPVRYNHPKWATDEQVAAAAREANRPTSMSAARQTQAEIMEQQNRGLEVLSATISRQRDLATQLGNEVEDQNNILDNLSNNMDRVESGVQQGTRGITDVTRRDSTWGYWLVIISLFVAILVVIFV